MEYRIVNNNQTDEVAKLAVCLISEIVERTGVKQFDIDILQTTKLCAHYVSNGVYNVMAAFDGDKIVGFGALSESHSLYAQGRFGIIQELYVMPEYRSRHVGRSLIQEIVRFSKNRQWKRLELCTPPIPEFDRAVEFYKSTGFEITGGYKMKYIIE